MQLNLSALIDAPVWQKQKEIGRVWRVVFYLTNGQVLGLLLDDKTVVYVDRVIAVADNEITVSAHEETHPGSLVAQAAATKVHVMNAAAVSTNGTKMGQITDVTFSYPLWQLLSIVAKSDDGERVITRDNIIAMRHDQVVVRDDLARKFDWNGADAGLLHHRTAIRPALITDQK